MSLHRAGLLFLLLVTSCENSRIHADGRDEKGAKEHVDKGVESARKGDWVAAIKSYDEAIRLDPKNADAHYYRGAAWHLTGDTAKAMKDYDECIRLNPVNASAFRNRALLWRQKGELDKAIDDCTEAIRLQPKYADAFNDRGTFRVFKSEWGKALTDFDRAIEFDPKFARALNNRAWIRATCPDDKCRDGNKAMQDATLACELTKWNDPVTIATLAAASAEKAQFAEAVKWQKRALEFKEYEKTAGLTGKTLLKLYEDMKPYREAGK